MRKKILIFGGTGTIGFSVAKNLRDDGVYQAFANAYINTSEKFTNNLSQKNFNAMVNNCIQCHEKFCLGTIQKINKLYIRK